MYATLHSRGLLLCIHDGTKFSDGRAPRYGGRADFAFWHFSADLVVASRTADEKASGLGVDEEFRD